jgi:hypothetical protein
MKMGEKSLESIETGSWCLVSCCLTDAIVTIEERSKEKAVIFAIMVIFLV